MKAINQILLPVDLRESTNTLVKSVIEVALIFKSKVFILAILPEEAKSKSLEPIIKERVIEKISQLTSTLTDKGIKVAGFEIKYGRPVDNVLELSEELEADLIFLAPHFFKAPKQGELGVYTDKIIRHSKIPVWVSNTLEPTKISKVLCPIDLSQVSARALKKAIILAELLGAELHILSVFTPLERLSVWIDADIEAENKLSREAYLKEVKIFLSKFDLESVNHTIKISDGIPSNTIIKFVAKNNIELLVMGVTGLNRFTQALIGSVTQDVIRAVSCSFVTTKDEHSHQ
jgi:universal stress protein E